MTWFFILITMQTCGVATFPTREACETKRAEMVAQFEDRIEYMSPCALQPGPKTPDVTTPVPQEPYGSQGLLRPH